MIRVTDKQYFMDSLLLKPLNTFCYNINDGHDFTIIVSGSGKKRIGKTTLAAQIGYYCAYVLGTPFDVTNIAFGGKELIETAKSHCPRSVIVDDESRTDLSSKRQMETFNKDLMDFFSECGKLNDMIILVAPDFFDISKSMAVTMSDLLINVVRDSSPPIEMTAARLRQSGLRLDEGTVVKKLVRGMWDAYNEDGKKKLYIWGKKHFDEYNTKFRFAYGEFRNFWPIDQDAYEKRKDKFINRERGNTKKAQSDKRMKLLQTAINNMREKGIKQKEIAEYFGVSEAYISKIKGFDLTVNS